MARLFYFFFASITILSCFSLFFLKFDVTLNASLNQQKQNSYSVSEKNNWKNLAYEDMSVNFISTKGYEKCAANISDKAKRIVILDCKESIVYPQNLDVKIILHQCPLLDILMTKFE